MCCTPTHTAAHNDVLSCMPRVLLQLVPRVNPALPLTESYVSADRQRLLLRLEMYALQERNIIGDGNCQVSSASRAAQDAQKAMACAAKAATQLGRQCSWAAADVAATTGFVGSRGAAYYTLGGG
eukprot:GHRQ01012178.1.p3 GENE.GHRQ01012178.1~~GHRQ01012178.1.p3  ORF type:complete len:125 (+),score=40.20 GHRQ01012178.1:520-894(+)